MSCFISTRLLAKHTFLSWRNEKNLSSISLIFLTPISLFLLLSLKSNILKPNSNFAHIKTNYTLLNNNVHIPPISSLIINLFLFQQASTEIIHLQIGNCVSQWPTSFFFLRKSLCAIEFRSSSICEMRFFIVCDWIEVSIILQFVYVFYTILHSSKCVRFKKKKVLDTSKKFLPVD
jgi:hypothetical protein